MKKLILYLTLTVVSCSSTIGLAADRYQQVFLKGPSQTQTVNIAAGEVAYMFGATRHFSYGNPSGTISAVITFDGVLVPLSAYDLTGGPLILAGPVSVAFTTSTDTHAEIAFLWTIMTRANPNIGGVGQ